MGGRVHPDGRPMTFSELGDECIEAGDLLTAGVIERWVAQRKTLVQVVSDRARVCRMMKFVCYRPIGARLVGWNRLSSAAPAGGLFSPRSVELGLAVCCVGMLNINREIFRVRRYGWEVLFAVAFDRWSFAVRLVPRLPLRGGIVVARCTCADAPSWVKLLCQSGMNRGEPCSD